MIDCSLSLLVSSLSDPLSLGDALPAVGACTLPTFSCPPLVEPFEVEADKGERNDEEFTEKLVRIGPE